MIEIIRLFTEYFLEFGYFGIFFLMTIESTFIPFPSVAVLLPAGFYASQGYLNLYICILCGIMGNLCGSLLNYFLALILGKPILIKLHIMKEKHFKITKSFFDKYGVISIFLARLLPLVRHYISLFAGLIKMNIFKFSISTLIGASIYVAFTVTLAYLVGENKDLIFYILKKFNMFILFVIVIPLFTLIFIIAKQRKKKFWEFWKK